MKIYIFTQFVPFVNEQIIAMGKTREKVERSVRELFPYMTPLMKSISDDVFVLHHDAPVVYGRIKEYETVD